MSLYDFINSVLIMVCFWLSSQTLWRVPEQSSLFLSSLEEACSLSLSHCELVRADILMSLSTNPGLSTTELRFLVYCLPCYSSWLSASVCVSVESLATCCVVSCPSFPQITFHQFVFSKTACQQFKVWILCLVS